MDVFFFWFWVLLIIVVIAAWPSWGYTRDRWPYRSGGYSRYYPSAGAGLLAALILLLFWLGIIAIAWPWMATAPVVAP
jgi:hypothetical protein